MVHVVENIELIARFLLTLVAREDTCRERESYVCNLSP